MFFKMIKYIGGRENEWGNDYYSSEKAYKEASSLAFWGTPNTKIWKREMR